MDNTFLREAIEKIEELTDSAREHLQIDHVVSVLQFAQKRLPYKDLNKEDNLALLCRSCNAAKEP